MTAAIRATVPHSRAHCFWGMDSGIIEHFSTLCSTGEKATSVWQACGPVVTMDALLTGRHSEPVRGKLKIRGSRILICTEILTVIID